MASQPPAATKEIISTLVDRLPKTQQAEMKPLVQKLLGDAPLEDLEALSGDTLLNFVKRAQKALDGKNSVAVEEIRDGDGMPLTLVVITMRNRPFIVDSVLAEIATRPLQVRLVVHPVVDDRSLMMTLLGRTSKEMRADLKKSLTTIVQQVRLVTDDWKPMLLRLEKAIINFRVTPPPLPTQNIAEAVQFLEWLSDNNFTLLGMREYSYTGTRKSGELKAEPGTALGLLRDDDLALMTRGGKPVVLTPEIRDFLFSEDPLIITKANVRSPVHRRTHLDYVGIKRYTDDGKLAGELRVVGLFTSTAYTRSVTRIPLLRHKANAVLEQVGADPRSHFGKALLNILETWPRDEMFQLDQKTLTRFAQAAARLEERPRIRALARVDKFDRFVSIVTYVPRDRYDTSVRRQIGDYLAEVYDGYLSAFFPAFLENGLTRIQFIIGRRGGKTPKVGAAELETAITRISRTWQDEFFDVAHALPQHDFPIAYQEHVAAADAVKDCGFLESLDNDRDIAIDFHGNGDGGAAPNRVGLKLFHLKTAVPLSRRVPMLENMGFRVIEESTFEITRADGEAVFLHDMILETASGEEIDRKVKDPLLTDTLNAVWKGQADNDNFNTLPLRANVEWRLATVFRAYAGYLRQIRSRFTVESMAATLANYPAITRDLSDLFQLRFDPQAKSRDKQCETRAKSISSALDAVQSSDDDRILRNFLNLIESTLRTNYYAPSLNEAGTEEAPTPVLSFKINPGAVNIIPQPVPYREIFVSSSRVEGLHLRFGPVARGGLRWSDRPQDYRTEVLGLVKAQQVKNAVIVPVGSKGGFVPKQLPSGDDRNAWFEEGRNAYKIFISSLLSVTDNLVDGKVVPPAGVVRHDGDDPYFVVAADKGTSTFSDTANAISQARDFWLDDAFASGGSAGYDHKKMGITARGGWEAVKRHFREMPNPAKEDSKSWDIQNETFTAVGVGDMSGDVFGNGMLLSKKTRLIAAFDHRDIFIDPDPDTAASFKERQRLFNAGRSSWQDYKPDLISKGGGVFSRSLKKISLSKQAADALGCKPGEMTPQEVMTAILKSTADLLWFGGIGTYIRASHESDADAGDRANDAIRITAKDLRCKVIGEGANLGVTQPARIEFNMNGGRCNSDAIDNSAGVNSSDVEVNIKIALAAAMKAGRLTRPRRNKLLESMTDSVADLVLRNNYLQTLAISLAERRGMEDFAHQQRLMQSLEARDLLDRAVEDLPDDAELSDRQSSGTPLTRAEIGVLLAYAKIVALDDLVASDVPDDPYLKDLLIDYFPPKMQKTYASEIEGHRLRREIIGTVLANSMINRGGPSFINRVMDRTGAPIDTIARAYVTVRDSFATPQINNAIDALDAKIAGDTQLELYAIVQERVISQTVWFVRYGDYSKGIGSVVRDYREAVETLMPKLEKIVPVFIRERIDRDAERFQSAGVPKDLARTLARMPIAGLIPDILFSAKQSGKPLMQAATAFFAITDVFRVGRVVQAASTITTSDYYDGLALDRALQSLHQARRDIVIDVLKSKLTRNGDPAKWMDAHDEAVKRTRKQMSGIVENDQATVSRLTVAANVLADLARV